MKEYKKYCKINKINWQQPQEEKMLKHQHQLRPNPQQKLPAKMIKKEEKKIKKKILKE